MHESTIVDKFRQRKQTGDRSFRKKKFNHKQNLWLKLGFTKPHKHIQLRPQNVWIGLVKQNEIRQRPHHFKIPSESQSSSHDIKLAFTARSNYQEKKANCSQCSSTARSLKLWDVISFCHTRLYAHNCLLFSHTFRFFHALFFWLFRATWIMHYLIYHHLHHIHTCPTSCCDISLMSCRAQLIAVNWGGKMAIVWVNENQMNRCG